MAFFFFSSLAGLSCCFPSWGVYVITVKTAVSRYSEGLILLNLSIAQAPYLLASALTLTPYAKMLTPCVLFHAALALG